jgi:hypothetical protein
MSIGSVVNTNLNLYPLSLSSANGIQTNMGSTSASIMNSIFTSGTATVYPIIGTPNSLSGAVAINPNGTPNLSAYQQLPILAYFVYLNNVTTNAAGQSATVNFVNPIPTIFCEFYDFNNNLSPLVHLVPVYSGNTCTGFNVAASGVVSSRSYSFIIFGV